MIAMALACGPTLLFADEPTTALDVTVQAQILDLIQAQRKDRNMSVILVTHDLGVVAGHRRDHRDVRGPDRGAGPDAGAVQRDAHAVHGGTAPEHPQAGPAQPHPAAGHRRPAA